jgi:hypothetical protein
MRIGNRLVGPRIDILVHAGEIEMRAVEQPWAQIIVGVVLQADQTLPAFGIGEDPGAKAFLDEFCFSRESSVAPWLTTRSSRSPSMMVS